MYPLDIVPYILVYNLQPTPKLANVVLLVSLIFLFLPWFEEREIAAARGEDEEEDSTGGSSTDPEDDVASGDANSRQVSGLIVSRVLNIPHNNLTQSACSKIQVRSGIRLAGKTCTSDLLKDRNFLLPQRCPNDGVSLIKGLGKGRGLDMTTYVPIFVF